MQNFRIRVAANSTRGRRILPRRTGITPCVHRHPARPQAPRRIAGRWPALSRSIWGYDDGRHDDGSNAS